MNFAQVSDTLGSVAVALRVDHDTSDDPHLPPGRGRKSPQPRGRPSERPESGPPKVRNDTDAN